MKYPNDVVVHLTDFLQRISVDESSDDWKIIQAAISLLNFPDSFKKGCHVFLTSQHKVIYDNTYDFRTMSIKLYSHKLVLKREHKEYNPSCGIDRRPRFRYIYPNRRYCSDDFEQVMSDTSFLFGPNESFWDDDCCCCGTTSITSIESNLFKNEK